MITAKVKYRGYVPWDYIAITFCDVDFYGEGSLKYKDEWDNIQYSRYDEKQEEIERLQVVLEDIKKEKKWYQFFPTKQEIDILDKIEQSKNDRFKSAQELFRDAEHFLSENGFSLVSSSSVGELDDEIYIWNKEEKKIK